MNTPVIPRARQERQECMRAMMTLMAGVAHEFNNLLGSIYGLAELNQYLLTPDHPAYENSCQIHLASDRAAELIHDMSLCAGSFAMEYSAVNPRELLNASLAECQSKIAALASPLQLDIIDDQSPALVELDITFVARAITHLIDNALDALRDTPSPQLVITITQDMIGDDIPCLQLCINDNGTGMDSITQAHIFDAFFTTKPPGQGRGLGLVTIEMCAFQHDGDVRIISALGSGTEVTLRLPLVAPSDSD
ncbi:MAG: sensor histidine kinase [Pseudomonadota bacterium]